MHILVEGIIMGQRYEYISNVPNNGALNTYTTGSVWDIPMPQFVPVKYKMIVDSRDLMLFITEKNEYFADIRKQTLKLTEEVYKNLITVLAKINNEEAILMNELKKEKALKEGKELKDDYWGKREVNALLGMEV